MPTGRYGWIVALKPDSLVGAAVRALTFCVLFSIALAPSSALAWGYEGHEIIALMARSYLKPAVRDRVDAMLAADTDPLVAHDMADEATWADRYRGAGHRETASWHFVDLELDHPDLRSACFDFPKPEGAASQGPANDCVVDKLNAFSAELKDARTSPGERLLALKYVLHFAGDLHQPLHASDNHDKGGNCVQVSLGGVRTTNLHAYWDTGVIQLLGPDASTIAASLGPSITPEKKAAWEKGDARGWALESYEVAKTKVYTVGSHSGCGGDAGPITFPAGYEEQAKAVAAAQLRKAAVRLALILNEDLQ